MRVDSFGAHYDQLSGNGLSSSVVSVGPGAVASCVLTVCSEVARELHAEKATG